MKFLIVDDTFFMRATIRKILENNNMKVAGEAENGLEAVKKYSLIKPDIVIMDISMPIMDGIEAVKRIIEIDKNANIIICSLQGQKCNVMEAIKSGAKSYLIKPLKEDKLMVEIAKITKNKSKSVDSETSIVIECEENNKPESNEVESKDYYTGVEKGYLEARREIATNMLRLNIPIETIKNCVELSEDEIEKFKIEYNLI